MTIGDGVWKSTDGGETWTNMGLAATGRISRVLIHPTDPDIVYVGSLGHAHAPQPERGVYRTMDGGESWEHVLFADENTGASSVEMDPNNPRILYAGMWHVIVNTWGRHSGGPGSGLYVSRDAGDTWTKLEGNGLPTRTIGKVDVCLTPADSNRVYALIETGDGVPLNGEETDNGELWRSDDGAETWQLMTHDQNFGGRTAYYNNCAVAPDDADEAYFLTAPFVRSIDGGRTGQLQNGRRRPGGDNHDIWIDPTDGDRMIVGNDGGLAISQNRGETWLRVNLPIAQMYHVTTDTKVPYNVYGNRQDGPVVPRAEQQPDRRFRRQPDSAPACGTRSVAARAASPRPTRSSRTSSGRPPPVRARAVASSSGSTSERGSSGTSRSGRRAQADGRPRPCATGSSGPSRCSSPRTITTRST